MRQKSTGTLVHDALTPAKRLFMISTGTGIAPFASLLRDPDTYEKFEQVFVTHTCRDNAELVYGQELVAGIAEKCRNGSSISVIESGIPALVSVFYNHINVWFRHNLLHYQV